MKNSLASSPESSLFSLRSGLPTTVRSSQLSPLLNRAGKLAGNPRRRPTGPGSAWHVARRSNRTSRAVGGVGSRPPIPLIGTRPGEVDELLSAGVILHDRSLPDRIATHILAFEGDSKVTFFDGNFSEYEDWRRQTLGDAATRAHPFTCGKPTSGGRLRPATFGGSVRRAGVRGSRRAGR